MPQRLLNKVAVVTGVGGPLGRAVVLRFLAEGAKVVAFDQDRGPLEELPAAATARVLTVEGDVTRTSDLETLSATTVRRFGSVDVLVPAAEIYRQARLAECTPEFLSELFAVNLHGALQTVRAFERHLNRGASIIFVTTSAPLSSGSASAAGRGPFSASKAAVASLARTLSVELSPRGIRVNCVAPTSAEPPEGTRTQSRGSASLQLERVAEAALFFASDNAAGVTGQELVVDTATA